ncbi:MAG: hypothetical protein Q4F54_05860 [Coriobacteriia bacterium]|nr:hypothetical protein [Coriobacteriia bacterium]
MEGKVMELDFELLINFVKAQEESPDNPVDVVNVSSQTGDFGIWLIIALFALVVVSAVAIFLYRKYSFNNAGHSVSGLNFTGFKSKTSTIVGVVVALIAACSILIYLGVSKAEAKNDVIPIEINAQVFSDGHIEVDDTSFPNTGDIPLIASSTYLILNEAVQGDEKLQASHLTFKAFEGTVFDGNPYDSYITEDAFGVVYPGEDCHLSIQIDNLDAQTALSYIDHPVYSLYMPVRYGDKLAFEVDPSDAPEANVLIRKDGS